MKTTLRLAGTLLLAAALPLAAQQPAPAAAPAPIPPVRDSADVKTLDGIMHAIYAVISGDSGQARDWDRFRSLFAPGARLIPTGPRPGGAGIRVLSADEYVTRASGALARQGFYEGEIARRAETYGPVTHLFSTYESRHAPSDAQPFVRGINSFQLFNDGARWYVVTIYWWGETPDTPIPSRYLASESH